MAAFSLRTNSRALRKTLPLRGLKPSRGVIEVKPLDTEPAAIAATRQTRDYLNHYGQVLLTNYRAFQLLWRDPSWNPARRRTLSCWPAANLTSGTLRPIPAKAAEQLRRASNRLSPAHDASRRAARQSARPGVLPRPTPARLATASRSARWTPLNRCAPRSRLPWD